MTDTVKGFFMSTNVMYRDEFHSNGCSVMILRVAIWSVHDLFLSVPPHASAAISLCKIILLRTFPGIDNMVIPL